MARRFGRGALAIGTISRWLPPDDEGGALFHVSHHDGDEEDLDADEVRVRVRARARARVRVKVRVGVRVRVGFRVGFRVRVRVSSLQLAGAPSPA